MKLDNWQQQVMDTKGNICLRSGRQVGKSTVISVKAAEYVANNSNVTVMVIAAVERQAYLLFEKILAHLHDNYRFKIKMGKDRPTKHRINLMNGSVLHCLPTGMTGHNIRGFTINLLIADEAAFIPEEVWTAVTPMLAITKGDIWLLSTPHGKIGYYYECFKDEDYTAFHVSSEDCPRKDDKFLAREKARMTKVQYAQEYLGEFVDELMQFFSDELIKKCMTVTPKFSPNFYGSDTFLGVDVARYGGDETVLASLHRKNNAQLKMINLEVMQDNSITDTVRLILKHDLQYRYKKIYIDDGGLGVGVFDPLFEHEQTKRKVEGINNAKRSINRKEGKKTLFKEDLYTNLLHLMESGKINLYDTPELFQSLKSVQYEYKDDKTLKIFGSYTHIAEALIRAAWCMKDKGLNIYYYS